MRILLCQGYKEWTDCGYEFDCGYGFDGSCEDCVCNGGNCDPRYFYDKQPKKLSDFIIYTKEVNEEINKQEYEKS
jgi:hypothetical protein